MKYTVSRNKKIVINFKKNVAKIIAERTVELFEDGAFVVEYDDGGFSRIEKREDGFHLVNYLRERDMFGNWKYGSEKPIDDRKISLKKARELMLSVLSGEGV